MSDSFLTAVATRASETMATAFTEPTHVCFICFDADGCAPLLQTGCGCRGSAGWVHGSCAVTAAAAQQERTGSWGGGGKHPWQLCPTCRVPYSGALKLLLAREWCRRSSCLPAEAPERFAARTTLGNALQLSGELAEAEQVVRANLQTAATVHGAEHRFTLGTRMNLGLLLGSLGKARESEAEFKALLAVQRRVLGEEHPDSLATALQLAGAALALGRNAAAEEQYRATLAVVRRKRLVAPPWAFVRRALTRAVLALCLAADPSAGRGAPEHARVRDEPGQRSGQPGQVRRGGEGLPRQPRAQAAQARAGARVPPRRSMPPCHVRCSRALPMTPREGKRERWWRRRRRRTR
jgi:hypothetical protein